jgi:hypothetical protein
MGGYFVSYFLNNGLRATGSIDGQAQQKSGPDALAKRQSQDGQACGHFQGHAREASGQPVCAFGYGFPEDLLFEIGQLENLHPTERVHLQQVNITRDKNIGFCRNGQLQKFIVLWVSAFCDRCGDLDQNHRFAEEPHPHQAMLKGPPRIELFTRQNRCQFIESVRRTKNIMLKNSTAKNFRWLTVWIQTSWDERTRIEDNSFTGVTHGQACLIVQV